MVKKLRKGFTSLPGEEQITLKQKYMEGYSINQLAKEFGLISQSLGYYVRSHGWDEERRLRRAELFRQFSDTKKAAFTEIYMDGTALLRSAIEDAKREYLKGKLSIKEKLSLAKQISDVISQLDKIQRLDAGSPTDIKEERPFVVKDIEARLRVDPFYQEPPKEVEYAEKTEEDSIKQTNPSLKEEGQL